jgi:hypothetical protein
MDTAQKQIERHGADGFDVSPLHQISCCLERKARNSNLNAACYYGLWALSQPRLIHLYTCQRKGAGFDQEMIMGQVDG